jgi:hypothetical protein
MVKRAESKGLAPSVARSRAWRLASGVSSPCCSLHIGDGNGVPPPVLKHGPRSQTDAQGRRYGCQYFSRTEREMRMHLWCAHVFIKKCPTPAGPSWVALECACLDPKGGELCLNKVKPGETQVEACSDADVQIARMIWVSERKTHRTT